MRLKIKWRKFLLSRIFGKDQIEPKGGLVLVDRISAKVLTQFPLDAAVAVTNKNWGPARIHLPDFKFIVGRKAVDTLTRTPEEIFNRIAGVEGRFIRLLCYMPGVDYLKYAEKFAPRVVYNDIIRTLTGAYFPKYKRLYIRAEEDLIRTALDNGLSPTVVRYNGTIATRKRFIRLAAEYENVKVVCIVLPRIKIWKPSRHEEHIINSWVMPTLEEGFEKVEKFKCQL